MNFVVSGHPRSGTSAVMQACEAGGLPVAKGKERDVFCDANSDENYKPNPNGLYELDSADLASADWPLRYDGHAVKIVYGNLPTMRPFGPAWGKWWPMWTFPSLRRRALRASGKCYRAIVMMRHPEEIRQSFEKSFGIERRTVERIETYQRWNYEILSRRDDVCDVKMIWYSDIIADKMLGSTTTLDALGWPIDTKKAMSVIDPALYRFRASVLVKGI